MSAPETPGQAAREADAEWEQAEWLHWAQANSVDPDCDRGTWTAEWMARAFKGGIQAERDPQQALPMAVAALRTIAWGSTPDGKPIDPSVVADRALAELKRLGYDEERLADAAHGQPAPAPGEAYLGLLADGWDAAARRTPGGDFAAALGTCASELRAALAAIAAQEPQPARGAPALREAVIAEVREAASCGSEEGDECPKCTRHAAAILAAFAAQEPKQALGGYVTINVRDLAIALNGCAGFTGNPAAFAGELHERLCRTVFAPKLAAAPDVRPREGEPGWSDVTCGICGAQFATNFRLEEIECGECEARRCPHCGTWFGEELP